MSSAAPIHPVILCGGSGTRLWPLSLKSCPKPFIQLIGDQTLFEQTVARASDPAHFAAPMIVAGPQHCDLIEAQLGEARDHVLVVEPAARNTAPAIAIAAAQLDRDAIMLVCPSDHHIADPNAFVGAAHAAARLVNDGYLVSFGFAAEHPETGYGYLRRGEPLPGGFAIQQFVEKPDLTMAQSYLESGDYSWNGGIFAFRAGQVLDELAKYRPQMAELVEEANTQGRREGNRFYPAADAFAAIDGDSIDYAVMENTDRAAMVPAAMGWSDIGNWASLQDALLASEQADGEAAQANIARGEQIDLDQCRNVMVNTDGPRVSAVGVEDICIIVANGEVLVTTRDGAQRVGKLPGAANQ